MRKLRVLLLTVFACISFRSISQAAWGDETLLNRSSFTITNDSLVAISTGAGGSPTIMTGGIFVGVVISTGESINFYDSISSTTHQLGTVIGGPSSSGNGTSFIPFQVRLSSGLTYTSSGTNSGGISIIYMITKPF